MIKFLIYLRKRHNESNRKVQRYNGMHYHYHKLLIMLCITLVIFNAFYIAFASLSGKSFPNLPTCETIGILLHFFLLASFFLMSSMSLLRYLMMLEVFTNIRRFNLIAVLTSYGLSALIVVITIVVPPGPSKYVSTSKEMYTCNFFFFFA